MKAKYGRELPRIAEASVVAVEEDEVEELTMVPVKIKVSPPDTWKGRYNAVARVAWIWTVEDYLVSISFKLSARLTASSLPTLITSFDPCSQQTLLTGSLPLGARLQGSA
jgi:hypothetical protein